jgi:hypothetical protein
MLTRICRCVFAVFFVAAATAAAQETAYCQAPLLLLILMSKLTF